METIKKKTVLLFFANLLVTAVVIGWVFFASRGLPGLNYSAEDWKTKNLVYRDSSFAVDDGAKNSGVKTDFFWGPFTGMKAGSYTAFIEYSAETDQECYADAYGQSPLMISSPGILSRYLHSAAYQFEVTEDIDKFDLRIPYNGSGDFSIRSISIVANNNRIKRTAVGILALTALADCIFIFLQFGPERKKTVLILSGIIAAVSLPLMIPGIYHGHDLEMHCLRIEAVSQALRAGQFPSRVSSFVLHGLGYPLSIYYNDIFLYFPALLRLLGFGVTSAYKIFLFSNNVLTVILSWICFTKIFKDKKTGILLTLLYASSAYRLVNLYVRAVAGEYTAQAFLPVLALAYYRIYTEEHPSFRELLLNSILLAVGLSGSIGSHIPSVMMALFTMLTVCISLIKKTFRKHILTTFIIGAFLTLLLNLYFLVPLIDYYINVPAVISNTVAGNHRLIQHLGAYPAQFFAFFRNAAGDIWNGIDKRLMLTPGLPLMMLFLVVLSRFLLQRNLSRVFRFQLVFSCLFLWLSSNVFPWNWFTYHIPFWRFLSEIQYPWRFLTIATLFLTLMAGEMFHSGCPEQTFRRLASAAVLMTAFFAGKLFDQSEVNVNIYDTSGVKHSLYLEEYLIRGSVIEKTDRDVHHENMEEAQIVSRRSGEMKLSCRTGNYSGVHRVTVPIYNYKGYHVRDDSGTEYEILNAEQNLISFELPDGFSGTVSVFFKDPWYWTAALAASMVTAAAICLFLFRRLSPAGHPLTKDSANRKNLLK